jgi:hypothetical protein
MPNAADKVSNSFCIAFILALRSTSAVVSAVRLESSCSDGTVTQIGSTVNLTQAAGDVFRFYYGTTAHAQYHYSSAATGY